MNRKQAKAHGGNIWQSWQDGYNFIMADAYFRANRARVKETLSGFREVTLYLHENGEHVQARYWGIRCALSATLKKASYTNSTEPYHAHSQRWWPDDKQIAYGWDCAERDIKVVSKRSYKSRAKVIAICKHLVLEDIRMIAYELNSANGPDSQSYVTSREWWSFCLGYLQYIDSL